jgi:hypothetical protein
VILDVLGKLALLADGQFGQVTTQQARQADAGTGLLDQLRGAGLVEDVSADVVRIRAGGWHPAPRLYAAWLALDPGRPGWERTAPESGVVSHAAALRLWRAGDIPGPTIEFTVPAPPAAGVPAGVVLHTAQLSPGEWQEVDGLPVTSPARTLHDIAATGRLDGAELGRVAHALLRTGHTSRQLLAAAIAPADQDSGVTLLDQWLSAADYRDG